MRHRTALGNTQSFWRVLVSGQVWRHHATSFTNKKELFLTVHGDDFTITGRREALSWIRTEMENKFEITAHVLGPDEGMENEIRVLNRALRWTESGITYEPDQRHAEIIVKELNLFRKQ